jgi:hypothetical protein
MNEHLYSFPPGGVSRRGTSVYSSVPWFARAAQAPAVTDDWNPDVDADSAEAFAVGDGPPAVGPTAENVVGGGDWPITAEFDPAGSEFDVTPGAFDIDAVIDTGGGYTSGAVPPNIILSDE